MRRRRTGSGRWVARPRTRSGLSWAGRPPATRSEPALRAHRLGSRLWNVDLEPRIGRTDLAGRRAELAPDDVRPERERRRLVERDRPWDALAAEATVGREHEVLGVDALERPANVRSDLVRRLDVKRPMADEADGHLLLKAPLVRAEELERPVVGVL